VIAGESILFNFSTDSPLMIFNSTSNHC
jgi:hypothetical protein